MRKTTILPVLMTATLLTAGCGGNEGQESTEAGPSATAVNPSEMADQQAPPARVVVNVMIEGGNVTPVNEQLEASVDQPIILRVNSDVADELHVHSNPEHTFKNEPKPGQSFQFSVNVPGKVDVELHQLKKTIATITVQ
ncbi:hypothetical protein [Mycobacterium barrassiae]|uniref:hypothetical protein n=1 Tax=Mycobacterium barrassiae TaxID=319709 RepID=UPI002265D2A2|nr:hypothetical protein [Mycobacterium barrassiae]